MAKPAPEEIPDRILLLTCAAVTALSWPLVLGRKLMDSVEYNDVAAVREARVTSVLAAYIVWLATQRLWGRPAILGRDYVKSAIWGSVIAAVLWFVVGACLRQPSVLTVAVAMMWALFVAIPVGLAVGLALATAFWLNAKIATVATRRGRIAVGMLTAAHAGFAVWLAVHWQLKF